MINVIIVFFFYNNFIKVLWNFNFLIITKEKDLEYKIKAKNKTNKQTNKQKKKIK